jgi:hypothetical protein
MEKSHPLARRMQHGAVTREAKPTRFAESKTNTIRCKQNQQDSLQAKPTRFAASRSKFHASCTSSRAFTSQKVQKQTPVQEKWNEGKTSDLGNQPDHSTD